MLSCSTVHRFEWPPLHNPAHLPCVRFRSRQRGRTIGRMINAHPDPHGPRVFDVLSHCHASLERCATLGDELLLALWSNRDSTPSYHAPGHHTLSVYLAGGFGTYLAGRPSRRGSPGRVCLMPAENDFHWIVEGPLRFLHLYVSERAWADRVVRLLDAEPRAVTLDEKVYVEDPELARWAVTAAGSPWDAPDARLAVNSASHSALDHLVLAAARPLHRSAALRPRGGLSGAARRRVVDWIEAHLQEQLTLSQLASQAALSEFHFARMFRVSMGVTPHVWVAMRRFARACEWLAGTDLPLDQVAAACGFAHASHLVRRFRSELGITPLQFRRLRR